MRWETLYSDWSEVGRPQRRHASGSTHRRLETSSRLVLIAQNDDMAVGARAALEQWGQSHRDRRRAAELRVLGCDGSVQTRSAPGERRAVDGDHRRPFGIGARHRGVCDCCPRRTAARGPRARSGPSPGPTSPRCASSTMGSASKSGRRPRPASQRRGRRRELPQRRRPCAATSVRLFAHSDTW